MDGPLRVLVGDFNATLDHVELRRLLATGYRDAASVVGKGLTPTWPYFGPRWAITPKVTIDHVLADRRIGVRSFEAFTIPGTDHRVILAELVIPLAPEPDLPRPVRPDYIVVTARRMTPTMMNATQPPSRPKPMSR